MNIPVIGIGASAGGLEALREFFSGSSGQVGMAFVVVQHLDPTHESLMAQLIERYTDMSVKQAQGGEEMKADHVYVIPPGHGLALNDNVLSLTEFEDPRGLRRPIDDFFDSLAQDRQAMAACVILSGTGGDGSRGMRAVKENGGLCVAQEPETARYDGMPASAIGTGLVDITAHPGEMLQALSQYFSRVIQNNADNIDDGASHVVDHLDDLCDTVSDLLGHDFSNYKRSTITRRVARRMQVIGVEDGAEYITRVREDAGECDALLSDLLINVTRFFRDRKEFATLYDQVIVPMVEASETADEIRIWVPGCSSGEEAYTLAMMLAKAMDDASKRPRVHIFATDIDEKMLSIARGGEYPVSALEDIPEEYASAYVIGGTDSFTFTGHVRDMIRFSHHDLIRDPPFSTIDLVSCRNLLIYFDDTLQKRVLPMFHFALGQNGTLFLGASESTGQSGDLFDVQDQSARIFSRRDVKSRYSLKPDDARRTVPALRRRLNGPGHLPSPRPENRAEISALKRVADSYAPVSLLVDHEGILLERWGAAGRFLDFPERLDRNVHLPTLARPGLREIIGPMLRSVAESGRKKVARETQIKTQFGQIETAVVCEPIDESAFLFIIRETGALEPIEGDPLDDFEVEESQLQFLESELQSTRQRLRSTVEELETTNEELKSSNEEMMSMNEELQSTNEELTTVNDELKSKVDEVTVSNADLRNFFISTETAALVVDDELKLRSFTEAAEAIFPLDNSDLGRLLSDLPNNLQGTRVIEMARAAAGSGVTGEDRVVTGDSADSREYIVRAVPYRDGDSTVDGATLVFTDVTDALELQSELDRERERLRLALEVAQIGVWEYEPATDITVIDETERRLLNIPEDDDGAKMEPILTRLLPEDRDRINASLRKAMDGQNDFDETFRIPLDDGSVRWLHGLGRRVSVGKIAKFIGVTYDVTAETEAIEQRELMLREMNHRVKNLFAVIAAMVSITAREGGDVAEFAEALRGRIHALARSHALGGQRTDSSAAPLRGLLETVTQPVCEAQELQFDGPDVTIPDSQVTSVALILHEWATNSCKYGALAVPDGAIDVSWTSDDGELSLNWQETGGVDKADGNVGFGSQLIEGTARQLRGQVAGEKTDKGYTRRLTFELADPIELDRALRS